MNEQSVVGIEAINLYGGPAFLQVRALFEARGLDMDRFDNLMMEKKSVGLPCEDPVTNAVNAAKPIIDRMSEQEKKHIELVIVATESGLDFGKAMSTYVQHYLGLHRNCRSFEVKHACYGGTAALQMAACFVAANAGSGAKALVIASDTARAAARKTYAEPTQAVGAVAMLVSDQPRILEIDLGASGYYSFEVMDTFRPLPEIETGDSDLSLLSYLDCFENSFKNYCERVEDCDFCRTFDYLSFHTPFAGMVKGAHRKMMRRFASSSPDQIESDFAKRVGPSLAYCVQIGNVYSATLYVALCSLVDHAPLQGARRIGLFSYGSGCASEFYSGVVSAQSQKTLAEMAIGRGLQRRYQLSMKEYDQIIDQNMEWVFGVKDKQVDVSPYGKIYDHALHGRGLLVLERVKNFHREYKWS